MKTSRSGLVHEINTDKETIRTELAKLEVDNSAEKAARDEQIQVHLASLAVSCFLLRRPSRRVPLEST